MIPNLDKEVLGLSQLQYWKDTETRRVKDSQKLYYWYYNYRDEILQYIETAMGKMFKPKTIGRMNLRVFNIVNRVVDKLALVYKNTPERMLDGGKREEDGQEIQSSADKVYQEILEESNIYQREIEWERLSKLFNTVLVQPIWNETYLDFQIHTPAFTVVETDINDYTKPVAFYFPAYRRLKEGKDEELVLIYWSAKEHFYMDTKGNKHPVGNNTSMVNPYGILPIAVLRRKLGNDFWGEGMWDLVDGNEEVCVQLSNIYYISVFQAHGQPFGVNLGQLKGSDGSPMSEPTLSPDCPILAENIKKDDAQPRLEFLSAKPELKAVTDLIDWTIRTIQSLKGLSPQQYDLQSSVASGISKVIDATDIQEIRQDDLKVLQNFEYDLFRVTKTVNNQHNSKKISSDKFSVKFIDPEVVETTQDKTLKRESGLKNNTISVVDVVMEEHPGMTRDAAIKKIATNMADNEKYLPKQIAPTQEGNLKKSLITDPEKTVRSDVKPDNL